LHNRAHANNDITDCKCCLSVGIDAVRFEAVGVTCVVIFAALDGVADVIDVSVVIIGTVVRATVDGDVVVVGVEVCVGIVADSVVIVGNGVGDGVNAGEDVGTLVRIAVVVLGQRAPCGSQMQVALHSGLFAISMQLPGIVAFCKSTPNHVTLERNNA
jgi:hypothetical protein